MAVQILTVVGDSMQALVDNANTAFAGLLDRIFTRAEFEIAETPRHIGREYRLVLTHTTATTPVASAFAVAGFEASAPQTLSTSLQAYFTSIASSFASSAFTCQIVTASRFTRRCAGLVFSCADTTQGPINWQAGGGTSGGGSGASDHPSLTDRTLINQHPAKAVSADASSAMASGANNVDAVTAAAFQSVTWHIEMDNGVDTGRVSTVRAQVDGAGAVTYGEYGITLFGVAALPVITVTYAAGSYTLTITTPGTGWTARLRRDAQF